MTLRNQSTSARRLIVAAVALCTCSTFALAQPAPPKPGPDNAGPPPREEKAGDAPRPEPVAIEGTVKGFNFGPGGEIESLMLTMADGSMTQVNFPPRVGERVSKAAALESKVQVSAEPTRSNPNHPVFELLTLTDADGKVMNLPRPDDAKPGHVEGVIKRLNYARDGRVNGAVLENDMFVHFGPAGAERKNLKEGEKLVVDGMQRPTLSGQMVIDANTINGTEVPHPKGPKENRPGDGPKPPRPPAAPER